MMNWNKFFLCRNGYFSKEIRIRPNSQIYLIVLIQLNTGLRIGDVLSLRRKNINNSFLNIKERKTNKIQNRRINSDIYNIIEDYCKKRKIKYEEKIFDVGVRWVQKYLQKIAKIIDIYGMSTHSFRKTYAHLQYINSNCNVELVRKLLNHSSISVTQRYLGINDDEVNLASSSFKIIF
jgi:integrase